MPIDRAYAVEFFDGPPDPWTKSWPAPHWETIRARHLRLTADGQVEAFTRDRDGIPHTRILTGAWGFNPL